MNNLPLEFHRDQDGAAKAVWSGKDESGHLLARFFESELGGDTAYCSRLEAEAEKHLKGHSAVWRTSGNSFGVIIENKKVSLHPLFGTEQNQAFDVELTEFLSLLHDWRELAG